MSNQTAEQTYTSRAEAMGWKLQQSGTMPNGVHLATFERGGTTIIGEGHSHAEAQELAAMRA